MTALTLQETNRTFWICFIFTFIFMILGLLTLFKNQNGTTAFLFAVWFLQLFLILLFAYYALIYNHHQFVIYILFLITLLFSTLWIVELYINMTFSNVSLVIALLFNLSLIYLSPYKIQPLGVLSILIWLFLFFYINLNGNV
ncbi:MAG TPA: hypothetical protein VLG50_05795 [Candidatus Saccharimonadales bacterium]|nr:hypothetical protein [Candidatus Saccharimonadales bacterium]